MTLPWLSVATAFRSVPLLCAMACASAPAAPPARVLEEAAERKRCTVAVLELEGAAPPSLLGVLGDEVRRSAVEAVGARCDILGREAMIERLTAAGALPLCEAGGCVVATGRALGADLVIAGHVHEHQGGHLVTLELHRAADGVLRGVERARGTGTRELLGTTRIAAHRLFD